MAAASPFDLTRCPDRAARNWIRAKSMNWNSGLTPEQLQLRNSVREFALHEIAPHTKEWDEHSTFPLELIPKLGELGLMGIIFPEEYGGAGLGYVEYSSAIQELARVDGAVALIV